MLSFCFNIHGSGYPNARMQAHHLIRIPAGFLVAFVIWRMAIHQIRFQFAKFSSIIGLRGSWPSQDASLLRIGAETWKVADTCHCNRHVTRGDWGPAGHGCKQRAGIIYRGCKPCYALHWCGLGGKTEKYKNHFCKQIIRVLANYRLKSFDKFNFKSHKKCKEIIFIISSLQIQ
jgi:hypothetical protein